MLETRRDAAQDKAELFPTDEERAAAGGVDPGVPARV